MILNLEFIDLFVFLVKYLELNSVLDMCILSTNMIVFLLLPFSPVRAMCIRLSLKAAGTIDSNVPSVSAFHP